VLYHEVRHAEQFFRGAQYYYQKATPAEIKKLGFDPGKILAADPLSRAVANIKNPQSPGYLKLPQDRESFGRTMMTYSLGYGVGVDRKIPYLSKIAERDAYIFTREGYNLLYNGKPELTYEGKVWNSKAFSLIESIDRANGTPTNTLSKSVRFDSQNRILIDGKVIIPSFTFSSLTEINGDLANNSLNFSLGSTQSINAGYLVSGKGGNDDIVGSRQNDYLFGDEGNDTIEGGNGNDQLDGGIDDDLLISGEGDDQLDGGIGADTLIGGNGDDTYFIDSVGDSIQGEDSISGIDTVYSSISLNLAVNLEDLTLTGIGNITGAGNGLDNILTGNDSTNILNGLGGDDVIYGAGGNDDLYGGDGNDYLYGDDEPSEIDGITSTIGSDDYLDGVLEPIR
jgi:Ca2+-binding RTX toxin-like protein